MLNSSSVAHTILNFFKNTIKKSILFKISFQFVFTFLMERNSKCYLVKFWYNDLSQNGQTIDSSLQFLKMLKLSIADL